jgi:hypothetical protein
MTVTNGSGRSRTGPLWTFTTSPGAVNVPPTAHSQSVSVAEDTSVAITLSGTDPEGAPLGYTVVAAPAHGTLGGDAPSVTYQPSANYNGSDSFSFRVTDGQTTSGIAAVSITVQAVNDPPVAVGDSYSTQVGGALTINAPGVLANDTDVEGSPLVAQLGAGPAHGVLSLSPNGGLIYTAAPGYAGPDSFTYAASDGQLVSALVAVNLVVPPPPPADTTAPVRSAGQPTGTVQAGTTQATVSLSTDENAACRNATTPGVGYDAMTGTFATTGGTSHASVVTGLVNGGSYNFYVRCRDQAGNTNSTDFTIAFSVASAPPPNPGMIAAYSFNEGTGTTLTDRTGLGHAGTISGATWITQGRFGGALTFDGSNDWVTIADANDLDFTTGLTLEAWVYPTASGGGSWRNVLIKERAGGETYNLYANADTNAPVIYVVRAAQAGAPIDARGASSLPLNTWTHLSATYDGTMLRLFVNGVQVGSRAVSGALLASSGVLRMGGNGVWGEFFAGRIDDVRLYNRALTASEIQTDMATPVTP